MMNMPNNTRRLLGVTFALAAMIATHVGAQETARQRAQRTLPPDVYERLVALGAEMEEIGVPAEPLFNKALEGAAKRVPTDRLLPAVQEHAGRLREARAALGPNAGVPLLVAGADALRRGVPSDALRSLPQDRPRSPVAVLVLAELLESGVPTDRALQTVREALQRRTRDAGMLDIPARVRRMVRDGVPPHEAIDRVRRLLRRNRAGVLGPALPVGDQPISDQKVRIYQRPPGG